MKLENIWNYKELLGLVISIITKSNSLFFLFSIQRIFFSDVYTRRTIDKVITLQSCFLDVLSKYSNIMVNKGFNLLDEYAARYINLSPLEENAFPRLEWNYKMYTTGSIANSHRILTEINKTSAITKVKILVELV